MNEPYLTAVGFPGSWEQLFQLFDRTQPQVQDLDPDEIDDFVSIMGVTDRSGVSLAFFEHTDDTTAQSVAVCGKGRNSVETWSVRPGLVELHVLQRDEVLAGLLVMVDDPHLYPAPEDDIPERFSPYWLGALAVDVTVYPNQDAWREGSEPLLTKEQATQELGGEVSEDIRIGPRFIASPGYWALREETLSPDDATPVALLMAVCSEVKRVRNELSGEDWYRVEADCGFPITVALPATTTPAPKPGSVLDGTVVLTGTTRFW